MMSLITEQMMENDIIYVSSEKNGAFRKRYLSLFSKWSSLDRKWQYFACDITLWTISNNNIWNWCNNWKMKTNFEWKTNIWICPLDSIQTGYAHTYWCPWIREKSIFSDFFISHNNYQIRFEGVSSHEWHLRISKQNPIQREREINYSLVKRTEQPSISLRIIINKTVLECRFSI